MRTIIIAALVTVVSLPADAQTDRFAPGNPTFEEFAATCRVGDDMHPECQGGPLGAFAEASGHQDVSCDWKAFWKASDERDSDIFRVLPWQYGVEFLVTDPGVCAEN